MTWVDRYHWTTPKDRWIVGRSADGSEREVKWSPLGQAWLDRSGKQVNDWTEWSEVSDRSAT